MSPSSSASRDEIVGEIMPNSGWGQRSRAGLSPVQPVAVGTDDGLVDGGQLGGLDGEERQLGGDGGWRRLSGIECGSKLRVLVLLLALALGQGGLGAWLKGRRSASLALPWAIPRNTDLDPVFFHLIGRHQLLLQVAAPRIQRESSGSRAEVIRRDPAEQGLGQRQSLLQATGHLAQQAVGDPYAEAIVDLAKMLQILQQAGLAGAPDDGWSAGKVGEQAGPVRLS